MEHKQFDQMQNNRMKITIRFMISLDPRRNSTVSKQLLIKVWQDFGFAYLFTQHENFISVNHTLRGDAMRCNAMHFNRIELYTFSVQWLSIGCHNIKWFILLHMHSVESSRWANTNCDRQQQMQNGECHNSGKCIEWQLQLRVTNALISNNNDSFDSFRWLRTYLSKTKT